MVLLAGASNGDVSKWDVIIVVARNSGLKSTVGEGEL